MLPWGLKTFISGVEGLHSMSSSTRKLLKIFFLFELNYFKTLIQRQENWAPGRAPAGTGPSSA